MQEETTGLEFRLEDIRADFPIFDHPLPNGKPLAFLDNASSTQKPRSVIDKQRECEERYYANAYRGVYAFGARVDEELESTRESVRGLLNAATVEEIIFTSGTTMSINLVAQSWGRANLKPGDEILLNEMEHHANIVPWQLIAEQTGAILKFLPLTEEGQLNMNRLDEFLTARTKLVAVTGMSNVLGTMPPIAELTQRAHDVGAMLLLDAAQLVPHAVVDVQSLDVDFVAFSGHKIYGPTGVGILYGKRELLEAMPPFLGGGHMIAQVFKDHSTYAEPPAKFEAGTLPIVQAIALGTAIEYVNEIGFPAIHHQEQLLLETATAQLLEIPGMKIYGPPPNQKGAIISFTIEGLHPQDLAIMLDRAGVYVRHGHHCTMPLHDLLGVTATTRASFSFYNTLDDVAQLIDGINFARKRFRLI